MDFYCHQHLLVVECDGEPHFTEEGIAHDRARDGYLARQGCTVLRFMNEEIEMDAQEVIKAILLFVRNQPSPPTPLPRGEGSKQMGAPSRGQGSMDLGNQTR